MDRHPHYRINEPNVVAESFGDEVVAVNLDTGVYYSMLGTAASIWKLLQEGHSVDRIIAALTAAHDAEPTIIATDTTAFLATLADEKLVTPTAAAGVGPTLPAATGARRPYVPPAMDVHSDMQDILLLDPVHDVDEAGWPLSADLERSPRVA